MKTLKIFRLCLATSIVLLGTVYFFSCYAASSPSTPPNTNGVTEVTSDTMDANLEKNEALFKGHVEVKDPTFRMTADEMTVYFQENTNSIERIHARGNVRIDQKNKKAESQEANYFVKEARIVLTGNPKVHEEGKTLEGKTITFFRNTQKTQVEGRTTLVITDPSFLPKPKSDNNTNQ
ncbi:MAG: lipopolysaccharide transport periplasmic protein LptA [Verrucomicrobiae bacterium]|nr:lipopolysaccharide transport periplasmic protein LptA [Verrucomicrobiae bacterium]